MIPASRMLDEIPAAKRINSGRSPSRAARAHRRASVQRPVPCTQDTEDLAMLLPRAPARPARRTSALHIPPPVRRRCLAHGFEGPRPRSHRCRRDRAPDAPGHISRTMWASSIGELLRSLRITPQLRTGGSLTDVKRRPFQGPQIHGELGTGTQFPANVGDETGGFLRPPG
jgi:hypothetical protein